MNTKRKGITYTVVALMAIMALFAGLFVAQHVPHHKKIDLSQFNGTVLETPRAVDSFKLQGINGLPFTNQLLLGQWTIFFFGFTDCGYLCPTTMAELNKMYRLLESRHVEPLPVVVMISIDPERDSLDKLKSYTTAFNPSFYGARGEAGDIEQLTHHFGVAYEKVHNKENAQQYDIQHSGALMLINPQGQLRAFFITPHQAALLADDYQRLLSLNLNR